VVSSPIVFAILSDPISDGFVQSLARPGGNITGLSMIGTDLESKRLQILKDGVPAVTKVMLLHHPTMGSTIGLEEVKSSARGLGLEIFVGEVADVDKLADITARARPRNLVGRPRRRPPHYDDHEYPFILPSPPSLLRSSL